MKRFAALWLILASSAPFADDGMQYIVRIDGITCPFCIATSERALSKVAGVRSVHSDLDTGRIFVCADATAELTAEFFAELFRKRGFTYRSVRRSRGCDGDARLVGDPSPGTAHEHAEPAGGGY